MKRLQLFAFLGILLLGLALAGCGGEEKKPEQAAAPAAETPAAEPVLKLGSMSPLTGPYSADGNDIANGARAAIDVVKAQGGIPGFSDIVLYAEDTACDPKQAVAAANKLISEQVTGVVGAYCSSSTIPASAHPGSRRHPDGHPCLHQPAGHRTRPPVHVPHLRT